MLFMGIWLMGNIGLAVVATTNFAVVDHVLDDSGNLIFHGIVERIGGDTARELLRYLASELNRLYFQLWNVIELPIGVLTLAFMVRAGVPSRARWCVVGMLAIAMLTLVWLTPQIVSVGRDLDFVARDPVPPQLRTFGLLHAGYTVLNVVKLILAAVAIALFSWNALRNQERESAHDTSGHSDVARVRSVGN